MSFLEISALSVGYFEGNKIEKILEQVNLKLEKGKACTILGSSGSGKTTLLKAIAGLAPILAGKIFIDSIDISNIPVNKRRIGYVPQEPTLFQHLSVYENIAFSLKIRKLSSSKIKERVEELAELVGIVDILPKPVTQISGGQAQRVSLCRSLAPYPNLLLMDEPFSSLDTSLKWNLALEFKKIQKELNVTTIHVTHDHYEASLIADYIGIIDNRKLSQFGPINSIIPNNWVNAKILGYPNVVSPEKYRNFKLPEKFKQLFPDGGYFDPNKLKVSDTHKNDSKIPIWIVNKSEAITQRISKLPFASETMKTYWVHVRNKESNSNTYLLLYSPVPLKENKHFYLSDLESAFQPFGNHKIM